jgi:hypothetical protein
MSINKKVIVYLDTQDYSKFSDLLSGKENEKLMFIFKKLVHFLERKEIVICYSFTILNELFQKTNNNQIFLKLNRNKTKIVELLCGDYCFLNQSEILSMLLDSNEQSYNKTKFSNYISPENKWINIKNAHDKNNYLLDESKNILFEEINQNNYLNEYEKRQAKKKIKKYLKDEKIIDEISSEIIKSKNNHPLLSVLSDDVCRDIVKSKKNGSFESISLFNMLKPSAFCEILENIQDMELFWENLNTMKFRFNDIVSSGLEIISKNSQQETPIDKSTLRHLFDNSRKIINDTVLDNIMNRFEINKNDIESKKEKISSFLNYIDLFLEISFQDLILNEKSKRSLKESDCGDLMHGFYIPYCDIWRSDKHYADRMKKYGLMHETLVIGDLFDLIPAIEDMIRQKKLH